ncbi:MAG: hypothetical protein ACLS90_06075 [Clostridia bacterium]
MNAKLSFPKFSQYPYYERIEKALASSINSIYIDVDVAADVNIDDVCVNVLTHKQNYIEIFIADNDFKNIAFLVNPSSDELSITVLFENEHSLIDTPIDINVVLPKRIFTTLSINSRIANIFIDEFVYAKKINIEGKSCNVLSLASFSNITINNVNGNIRIETKLVTDTLVNISSENADIYAHIKNIRTFKVLLFNFPKVKNSSLLGGDYSISGSISSRNGFVKFC